MFPKIRERERGSMFPKILEFLMWVIPLVVSVIQAMVSVIQAVRQPVVEDIIHHSIDALCGFVSRELGRLWRFASQKKPQKIEEELKTQIKEVEAENEVLREKNRAIEKQVADLQKIEEQLKIEKNYFIKVAAKNEVQLKKYIDDLDHLVAKNEVLDKKVVDLQKIEEELKTQIEEAGAGNKVLMENNKAMVKKMVDLQKIEKELKTKIKEAGVENKVLKEKNEAPEKKLVQSPVHGSFGGQILSLTFEGKIGIIKSNIGEEGGIPLGPWGGNGGGYWAYKVDVAPTLEITLCYGQVIKSIKITRKSTNGSVIGCSERFGGPGGQSTFTLCIDSSIEQLSAISLTYGDWHRRSVVTSLSFYSNRDRYGPYGQQIGSTVSIPIEEGTILAGLHGRGGSYLDAFGVLIAPKVLNSSHKASGSGLHSEEI